jgi:hypothetical protein
VGRCGRTNAIALLDLPSRTSRRFHTTQRRSLAALVFFYLRDVS